MSGFGLGFTSGTGVCLMPRTWAELTSGVSTPHQSKCIVIVVQEKENINRLLIINALSVGGTLERTIMPLWI